MHFIKKHPLLFLFLGGLLIRIGLLFVDYSFDVNNHIAWAKDLHMRGFANFFTTISSETYATPYPNYPPIALFIFYAVYPLGGLIFSITWWLNITFSAFPSAIVLFVQQRLFLAGLLKLPAIFTDIAFAYLLLQFSKRMYPKSKTAQILAPSLILFNPVFFYNSAFWGQIDIIPLFFLFSSYYVLQYMRRANLSIALFTLSLLVKPTTLIFSPVYLYFFIKQFGVRKLIQALFLAVGIAHLCFLPFLSSPFALLEPYTIYTQKILAAQSLAYTTNGAFNFWVLITQFIGIKDTDIFLLGLSYQYWGYLFTTLSLVSIYIATRSIRSNIQTLLYASFLIGFASFLFLTKMHERYFMLPLPFLLLLSLNNAIYLRWFIVLSILAFINLYHSWAVPHISILFSLIDHPIGYIALSLINIAIFIHLLLFYRPRTLVKTKGKAV